MTITGQQEDKKNGQQVDKCPQTVQEDDHKLNKKLTKTGQQDEKNWKTR